MTYYAFFDSEKQLVGASKNKIIQDASGSYDVVNTEIDEELYNDYIADPLKYIAGEKEIEIEVPDYETVIEEYIDENGETQTREIQNQTGSHTETVVVPYPVLNPNYEQEKAAKEKERINNLTMTPLDFIGVLQTFGLTLEQISTYLENNLAVKMQLTYCNNVYCGVAKSLMPVTFENITITADMVERAFRAKYGE